MKTQPQEHRQPLLVSKTEARWFLGNICMRTLEKLIARKELPVRRIGRRAFIPYSALVAFARRDHATKSSTEVI
jgi:hypothetical protein